MNRRIVFNVGKYLLAFGVLAWVVHQNWLPGSPNGLAHVWQKHVVEGQSVHTGFLLAALLAYAAAQLLTILRWYVLVRAQGLPFRLTDALRLGLIGVFFNNVLPSSVGGDVIKAAFLGREQNRRTVAVATVLMDRLIALWGLFWFVALLGGVFWLAGGLDNLQSKMIVAVAAVTVAVSAVVWLLVGLLPAHRVERFAGKLRRLPKLGNQAAVFWQAVWVYRCRQRSVALALLISWVGFVNFVLAYYFSVRTLWDSGNGAAIPTLAQHFLLVPIGLVIMAMPLFPGGAGIGELGYGKLYAWFRCSEASGVLGSLVQRTISWVIGLVGFIIYGQMRASLSAGQTTPAAGAPAPAVPPGQARKPVPETALSAP
jgi:uncharacterized protein (TIRG00374 family)